MIARIGLAAAMLAAGVVPAVDATEVDRPGALERLHEAYYAFEVAGYCGLVSPSAARGFRAERRRLEAAAEVSAPEVDRLRGKAWQAANAEWQNRGLGGFRRWCAEEGRAYAERFEAIDAVTSR